MKLTSENITDNQVEIVEEQQQRKEVKLIGQQRKIRGLTLWEFNYKTKELKPAQYKKQDVQITSLNTPLQISNKVDVKENCIYFQALNKKNAERKLNPKTPL